MHPDDQLSPKPTWVEALEMSLLLAIIGTGIILLLTCLMLNNLPG
jgi:hypothetical protein